VHLVVDPVAFAVNWRGLRAPGFRNRTAHG